MPREIRDSEQFNKLIPKAVEMRVVRQKEIVKLKIRTPDYLYTYKTTEDEAQDIIKNSKDLEVIEITPAVESETKEEKKAAPSEEKKKQPAGAKKKKEKDKE